MGSPETHHANGGQREVSSPERIPADDRLVPLGPHGNQGNLHAGHLFEQTHVFLCRFRQVAELLRVGEVLLPPLHLLVHGFHPFEFSEEEGHFVPSRSARPGSAALPRRTAPSETARRPRGWLTPSRRRWRR